MKRLYMCIVATVVAALVLVRAALAAAPAGRYTVMTATVFDNKTSLTWQRLAPTASYVWADAMSYCGAIGSSLGGGTWRLPTVKELETLVDDTVPGPTIDPTFTSTPIALFWSSTPLVNMPSNYWIVSFGNGNVYTNVNTAMNSVRCVR